MTAPHQPGCQHHPDGDPAMPIAVLLLDGRVLVFGGCCDASGGDVPGAEVDDPDGGS